MSAKTEKAASQAVPEVSRIGTTTYWIGLVDQAPVGCVTLGGHTFTRRTQIVGTGHAAVVTPRHDVVGDLVELDAATVEAIRKDAARLMIQRPGARVVLVNSADPTTYRPSKGEEPVGRYCYCVAVQSWAKTLADSGSYDWRAGNPPTLIS